MPKSRKRKTVSIDENVLEWVEEQIEKGKFHSFNHAVEIALEKLRDSEKERKE